MLRGQEEGKRKAWPLLPTGSPRTMALGLFPLFLCRHFLSISLLLHSLLPLPFTHSVQTLATFLAGSLASQCPKAQLATEEMLHPSALFTQMEKTAVAPFTPTSKSTVLPCSSELWKATALLGLLPTCRGKPHPLDPCIFALASLLLLDYFPGRFLGIVFWRVNLGQNNWEKEGELRPEFAFRS